MGIGGRARPQQPLSHSGVTADKAEQRRQRFRSVPVEVAAVEVEAVRKHPGRRLVRVQQVAAHPAPRPRHVPVGTPAVARCEQALLPPRLVPVEESVLPGGAGTVERRHGLKIAVLERRHDHLSRVRRRSPRQLADGKRTSQVGERELPPVAPVHAAVYGEEAGHGHALLAQRLQHPRQERAAVAASAGLRRDLDGGHGRARHGASAEELPQFLDPEGNPARSLRPPPPTPDRADSCPRPQCAPAEA